LASPLYNERAETTKRNYRRVLDQLRKNYGAGLLRDLKPRHVRVMRNEIAATSTTAADIAMSLISALWDFAIEKLGVELDADPTHGIKRVHEVKHEHEPWPPELIERFMREARSSLCWAVKLALYTGQRRSDLVKMKWSQFDGEFIEVRQQKTGASLSIPCHEALRAELENMPRVAETILVGESGRPLTGDSLSVMVRRQLKEMGVDGYAIHGLRKNAAVELANAGCQPMEIAAKESPEGKAKAPEGKATPACFRAPPFALDQAFTTKQASCSSTDHGGGKRHDRREWSHRHLSLFPLEP
jgi:integrase